MISRVLTRCAAIVNCRWAHATECTDNGFTIDLTTTPDAARLLKWEEEKDAYVHGYWQWDCIKSWEDSIAVDGCQLLSADKKKKKKGSEKKVA